MKKFVTLLLTLVLCISVLSVTAFAAGAGAFEVVDQEGTRNEEVVVPVKLVSNPGIAGMDITIEYDQSRLEKVSYKGTSFGYTDEDGEEQNGTWTISKHAIWDCGSDSTYTGTILKLTFKVKEDAPAGDAEIKVTCTAGNWAGEYVTIPEAKGYVTIPCDHSWNDGVVTTEPDCDDAGVKTYTCSECGETYTEEIPALGHSYDDGVQTKAPTCTEPGEMTYTCAVCGDTYTEEISATGHKEKYVDGELYYEYDENQHWNVCESCGAQMNKEAHVHDQERDGYYYCECGHKGPAVEGDDDDDGYDDETDVGDITGQLTFSVIAVIAVLTTAMVLVFKRKAVK